MKPWPKDTVAIICSRIDDPYRKEVPGSKVTACWHCNEAVMISPATAARVDERPSTIVCPQCIRGYYDESGQKLAILPDTSEQQKERMGG